MYAVIETGGKQYQVSPGDKIRVELLEQREGAVSFDRVLLVKTDAAGAFNIECQFEVRKGEEPMIKFAPQAYTNPFISQPLPMKQTLVTKQTDEKGNVKESQKSQDLGAGSYSFIVKITDKISGLTCEKKVDFSVVSDLFMTPTAALADIVLPSASYLEFDAVIAPPQNIPIALAQRRVVEIGESYSPNNQSGDHQIDVFSHVLLMQL